MSLPDIDSKRAPEELAADIMAYIDAADQLVARREPLSLAGLDTVVESLCQRLLAMDDDAARALRPKLEEMMQRLDALQGAMAAFRGEIATTLKSLNTRQKAVRAYHKTPEA
jgi:hypothetical protein